MDITNLNPHILDLIPYVPGKPLEELKREFNLERVIKLGSNENPLPLPPHVCEAISREIPSLGLYPDTDSFALRKRLAEKLGVKPGQVTLGAGSSELIKLAVRAFLSPGGTVLTSEKTFLMYTCATLEQAGRQALIEVPMTRDHRYDMPALLERIDDTTRIVCITNPNNPTGTCLKRKELEAAIARIPERCLIILDNAYEEYVADPEDYLDGLKLSLERGNMLVLRTFSKIHALAGLRVGYGVAEEEVIGWLNRVRPPFHLTRISQAAALASLENDDFVNQSRQMNLENRPRLFRQLEALGVDPVPSEANFIMFFPKVPIDVLNQRLLRRGLIIRPLKAFGVPDAMRITVGLREENDEAINILTEELQSLRGEA